MTWVWKEKWLLKTRPGNFYVKCEKSRFIIKDLLNLKDKNDRLETINEESLLAES